MTIEPGSRLAHYEIVSLLGRGGMGEVWRAKDTKLGREVAIKVLPTEFTKDSERLARFEREARVLASLHHSNIALIHGIEESDGTKFLIMQLAEGEDLSERLRRGPIPVDEALPIARQIAEALDVAHERGVIHRDLKPANVKVDAEGHVTILDFGLAKAMDVDEGDSDISNSPTMLRAATHSGVILGTAAYMSPEQARGKKVDRRADIFAFGVVLWEMLTGRRLFLGETVSDTLAAVLTKDADLEALPAETPMSIRRLVARCLDRNPKRRLRDIGEAVIVLEGAIAGEGDAEAPTQIIIPSKRRSEVIAWAVAAVAVIALATVLVFRPRVEPATPIDLAVRTEPIPGGRMPSSRQGISFAISPDGQTLVFMGQPGHSDEGAATTGGGRGGLWLRKLGDLAVTPIAGTDGARSPFFSPDGEWIGYFSSDALMKVAVAGGSPMTLCKLTGADARGAAWGNDGVIVFARDFEGGLFRVSADGGELQGVTTLDATANERSHRWPQFLPDGHSVLFMAQIRGHRYDESVFKVVDLENGEVRSVGRGGAFPRYVRSGHLAWLRENTLFTASFDLGKMQITGSPRPTVENVMSSVEREAGDDGSAQFDVSTTGVLVYRNAEGTTRSRRLVILDSSGKVIARGSRKDEYRDVALSPDGSQVATVSGDGDVWIWDSARDTMSRFTFEGEASSPLWSPDGRSIVYSTVRGGKTVLAIRSADGSGDPRDLLQTTQALGATSWSPDGKTLIASRFEKSFDVIAIPLTDGKAGEPVVILGTPAAELMGSISPDGRWLAYMSNESGSAQSFVRPLAGSGGRWQVSEGAGISPHWIRGGREIVYWSGPARQYFGVDVDPSSGTPKFGRAHGLFAGMEADVARAGGWDAASNADRFVFAIPDDDATEQTSSVVIVTDWFDRLKKLEPAKAR